MSVVSHIKIWKYWIGLAFSSISTSFLTLSLSHHCLSQCVPNFSLPFLLSSSLPTPFLPLPPLSASLRLPALHTFYLSSSWWTSICFCLWGPVIMQWLDLLNLSTRMDLFMSAGWTQTCCFTSHRQELPLYHRVTVTVCFILTMWKLLPQQYFHITYNVHLTLITH